MKARFFPIAGLLMGAFLAACDRPVNSPVIVVHDTPVPEPVAKTRTLETERLGEALDRFEREPTSQNEAAVKERLAKLDGEIAELEGRVARVDGADREESTAKLNNLKTYRTSETVRFTAARTKGALTPAMEPDPADGRTGAEKAKDSAERAGDSIKDAAHDAGQAIKNIVK